ncbi:hypothetical protein [Pseudoclavibacter sp. Z016]|uniref:hypothetical protein n=1 Tax=Pseudoclavibacter sp. Z016 TaxID=2080581 RepID=UPI000CE8E773|nr:hypothetical protein [Pseudoclavibacter sp. Z016]PPF74982.1 hypothetical protein C5B99_12650 [Pseudoclavibacter sp. Z016]
MTAPDQPKLPPRKPVELPPIDRTPVDDTSNAAYSALTPRSRGEEKSAPAVESSAPRSEERRSPENDRDIDPAVAHVQETAMAPASARAATAPAPPALGLSRLAVIVSVLLSLAAAVLALALSASVTPSPLWPLYLGASLGAVALLLAVLGRRHRGWVLALVLAVAAVAGCIGFAFVVA